MADAQQLLIGLESRGNEPCFWNGCYCVSSLGATPVCVCVCVCVRACVRISFSCSNACKTHKFRSRVHTNAHSTLCSVHSCTCSVFAFRVDFMDSFHFVFGDSLAIPFSQVNCGISQLT